MYATYPHLCCRNTIQYSTVPRQGGVRGYWPTRIYHILVKNKHSWHFRLFENNTVPCHSNILSPLYRPNNDSTGRRQTTHRNSLRQPPRHSLATHWCGHHRYRGRHLYCRHYWQRPSSQRAASRPQRVGCNMTTEVAVLPRAWHVTQFKLSHRTGRKMWPDLSWSMSLATESAHRITKLWNGVSYFLDSTSHKL